jgi:hypothetical protein
MACSIAQSIIGRKRLTGCLFQGQLRRHIAEILIATFSAILY